MKKVAGMLEDEKTVKQYEEAMRVDGTEKVDPQLVSNRISSLSPRSAADYLVVEGCCSSAREQCLEAIHIQLRPGKGFRCVH